MSIEDAVKSLKAAQQRTSTPLEDPRLPIIAHMAAVIFTEKVVYNSDREARRIAVDQAFLLYGEVSARLKGAGQ